MTVSLDPAFIAEASAALREANLAFSTAHPGESPGRQPVHTVYGGAQLFAADSVPKLGELALRSMDRYATDAHGLGLALDIANHPALETIAQRVRSKLAAEPIEDFRIDFEDGYGNRPDAEEDHHAAMVARAGRRRNEGEDALGCSSACELPLNEESRARSVRIARSRDDCALPPRAVSERWP